MSLFNTVQVAVKALLRNPTRALLTTLGIVIGIAAVITMMEIGNGSSSSIRKSIEEMGVNTLVIIPGMPRNHGGVRQAMGTAMSLTPDDYNAIVRDCVNISCAAPIVSGSGMQFIYGGIN